MRNKFILVAAACCTLLAASAAGSAGSGEASPAPAPEKKWLVPEAEYRLSVQPELPAEATSVDMRRQVLPVLPENGVRVFDDAGNPVPFQFHDNYSLSIAPAPKAKAFDIYFGFKEKQPADTWKPESGVRPPAQRLLLAFYWGGNRPCTPEEFLDRRNREIERQNQWHVRNFPNRTYMILRQRYQGVETVPWVPKFPQYWKNRKNQWKRLVTKNRNQRISAFAELTGRPRIQRMQYFNYSWQQHMKNHFAYIKREQTRIANLYAQARRDMVFGAENNLLGMAGWRNPRTFIATEVQLLVRPPETQEHYSARFSGFLEVPADGEYEFELMSNSLAVMRLNGQILIRRTDANGSQPPTREVARISLKKGSVPFDLFYRLNSGYGQLTARMRPAGTGEFELLAAEHFTPARAGIPKELADREKRNYPLLARRSHYLLYTGKRESTPIESFQFQTPPEQLEWRLGEGACRPISELPPTVVLPDEPEKQLSFRLKERPETELPVLRPDYRADLVELRPDLSLRLWAPAVVYEDETLSVMAETVSRLPFEVEAELAVRLDGADAEKRTIRLAGKPDERFNRAAADIYRKDAIELPPSPPKEGAPKERVLDAELAITGFTFDRRRLTIVPVASGRNFEELAGEDGAVLVLRRPKLSDIRNWELPRKIGEELIPYRRLLVIGEAADGAAETASEAFKAQKQTVEFVPYDDSENPLESSLFRLLDRIAASDADRAVLILPCLRHMGTLEPWMRDRYIAVLLEKLRANRKLHAVYLSPSPAASGEEDAMGGLLDSLRRLAREYDVQLLEPLPASPAPAAGAERTTHTAGELTPLFDVLKRKL